MTFKLGQVGDLLRGGKGDFRPDSDFSSEQLAKGKKHEREHTKNPQITKEIAKDHLAEDPSYYTKLEKIEKKADSDSKARGKQEAKPDLAPNKTNLLQIPLSTKQLEDVLDSISDEMGEIEKGQQQTGEQIPLDDETRRQKLVNQQSALKKVFRQRQFNITEDLTASEMQELADGFNIVPYDPLAIKKAFELGQPDIKDDRLYESPTEKKPAIQPHELAKKIPTVNPLANSDNADYKRPVHTGAGTSIEDPSQIVMDGAHTKRGEERVRAEVIATSPDGVLGKVMNKHWFKLPGGGVEKGERPQDAVRRETIEEAGHNLGDLKPAGKNEYKIPAEEAAKSKHKNSSTVNHLFVAKSVGKIDVDHPDRENFKFHPFKKVIKILADAIKSPANSLFKSVNKRRLAAVMDAQRSAKMALFNPQEVAVNMFFEGITDDLVKNGFYVENPVEFFVGAFNEMRAALMGDTKTAADGFPDWVVNACRTFARKHELLKEATKHNFQFARAKTADFSQLQPVNPMQEQKITPPQAGAINPVRMEKRQDIIDALLPYAQGITAKPDGEIKITMPDYTQEQQNLGMTIPQSNEEQMARAKAQQFSEQSLQASQSNDPSNPAGGAGGAPGAAMPEGGPNDSGQPMPGAEAGETPMGGGNPDVSKLMQILSGSQMQG